ncbi:hypothetical protein FE784_32460 [Paenibacillus hemerocallicola]|uniref:Glycine zipper domain-containing protein n=1 Tax=Paenibacillus hemerocallicola TaxID=1172614 RepID=A0A5C4T032_9BACL|nr:glycine zipper domain-containing protein [Paenibacillus hemerocallicola]TNJ62135.1 hypothetical protein FE784_32460 [Paenibacillus hemerocallicola]
MAKKNDRNRNDGYDRNTTDTNGIEAGEALGTVGGGVVGAAVGSALGPIGTVVGGIVGGALGNKVGEGADHNEGTTGD